MKLDLGLSKVVYGIVGAIAISCALLIWYLNASKSNLESELAKATQLIEQKDKNIQGLNESVLRMQNEAAQAREYANKLDAEHRQIEEDLKNRKERIQYVLKQDPCGNRNLPTGFADLLLGKE